MGGKGAAGGKGGKGDTGSTDGTGGTGGAGGTDSTGGTGVRVAKCRDRRAGHCILQYSCCRRLRSSVHVMLHLRKSTHGHVSSVHDHMVISYHCVPHMNIWNRQVALSLDLPSSRTTSVAPSTSFSLTWLHGIRVSAHGHFLPISA